MNYVHILFQFELTIIFLTGMKPFYMKPFSILFVIFIVIAFSFTFISNDLTAYTIFPERFTE